MTHHRTRTEHKDEHGQKKIFDKDQCIVILDPMNRKGLGFTWIGKEELGETAKILYKKLKRLYANDKTIALVLENNNFQSSALYNALIEHMDKIPTKTPISPDSNLPSASQWNS